MKTPAERGRAEDRRREIPVPGDHAVRSTATAVGPGARPLVGDQGTGAERRGEPIGYMLMLAALLVAVVATAIAELVHAGIIPTGNAVTGMAVTLAGGFLAAMAGMAMLRRRSDANGRRVAQLEAARPARHRRERPGGTDTQAPAYASLGKLASRLNASASLDGSLTALAEEAARATRTPVAVFLIDRSRERLFLAGAHALPEAVRRVWPAITRDSMERLFAGERIVVATEVATSAVPDREIYAAVGVVSAVLVRMDHRRDLVGVLAAMSLDEPRAFTADDCAVLQGMADQASQAIANAWLLAKTERRLGLTQALRNIDIAIAGSMDLGVTLNVILEEVTRQMGADAACVLLLDPREQMLTHAAHRGFRTDAIRRTRLRIGEDRAGNAVLERRIVSSADVRKQPEVSQRGSLIEVEGMVSYHALPLVAKGEVKGVLEVFHRSPFEPDAEWLESADAIAGQAAIAIDSATLFAELQRANESLTLAYDNTLEGWSRALDLRDRETEGHTHRVTELTVRLASAMGMEGEELVHARRGAILHDIGKMGIPDAILLKPGPLTDDEWLVMRRHPQLAFELLTPIPYLKPALDIPFCHHERWNGTGYPRGLSGEQIPISARLFAVADVWDALRSDRPYRPAWPSVEARDYIHSLAGTHFDPRAVDLFERVAM